MRSCALFLVAGCTAAPSLEVSVHHATGYAVTKTVVTVYAGDDVSCNEIQFGDRTEAELGAITVDEFDATGGHDLDVTRLGGKSIVARGYDAQRRFVTAGCKDIGEIVGTTTVTIDTRPTAVVAIDPGQADQPFASRNILVTMTDINGAPLDGIVSWVMYGPAGTPEPTPSMGLATSKGDVTLEVTDLGMPGPEAVRIRVPWAIARLPLVTGFDLSNPVMIPLGGGALGGHSSCDLRGHAGGPPTLVCLTSSDAQGHRDIAEIAWQGSQYRVMPIAIPAAINNEFALFVDHNGDPDEPIYVISSNPTGANNWYRVGGASKPIVFDNPVQNVVYVPKCGGTGSGQVEIETGTVVSAADGVGNKHQRFNMTGTPADTLQDGAVLAAGCVADVDKREHQGVVVLLATADIQLELAGVTRPIALNRLAGSGFVAIENQGMIEKRFATTRVQATGTVVVESVLASDNGVYRLVERTEVESAAPPSKILSGKLDVDGDSDLVWDMNAGLRRRLFQVSLAKHVAGVPLTAMTSGPGLPLAVNAGQSDFLVGDLDGQHTDEMIVFNATNVTIYSAD
jgi:hypothetical protein